MSAQIIHQAEGPRNNANILHFFNRVFAPNVFGNIALFRCLENETDSMT